MFFKFLPPLLVFWVVFFVNLKGEKHNRRNLIYLSKPFLMPVLAYFYYLIAAYPEPLIFIALALAWIGDIFLMWPEKKAPFLLGLTSFLAGHLAYAYLFWQSFDTEKIEFAVPWIMSGLVVLFGLIVLIKLLKHMGVMLLPIVLYLLVILGMVCLSFMRVGTGPAYWLPAIGSMFFIFSDAVLALNTFRGKTVYGGVVIMSTYCFAQIFIVLGFVN